MQQSLKTLLLIRMRSGVRSSPTIPPVFKNLGLTKVCDPRCRKSCRWIPPDREFVKLNFDGSYAENGQVGGGFSIRSAQELKAVGYSYYGAYSLSQAECLACRGRVSLAIRMGVRKTQIESDSQTVSRAILETSRCPWRIRTIRDDIIRLLHKFEDVQIGHVYRENNRVFYRLAKEGVRSRSAERIRFGLIRPRSSLTI